VRIDLTAPDLRVVVKGGAYGSVKTLSTKVSSFVSDNQLAAGINAVPFYTSSEEEGKPITNTGIVVSGGVLIAPPHPRYDALVWYTDGSVSIVSQPEIHSVEEIENAVGGFYQILKANELTGRVLDRESRHPRSAAGISSDSRYLYLLAIDGRRFGSAGTTEAETALLLKALGCWDGINLDGGGSSSLALRYPDGTVRVVNTPVHDGVPGRERAVAGCLGFALNPSTEK
jgi:exopolysaccharide biosynthesis protein